MSSNTSTTVRSPAPEVMETGTFGATWPGVQELRDRRVTPWTAARHWCRSPRTADQSRTCRGSRPGSWSTAAPNSDLARCTRRSPMSRSVYRRACSGKYTLAQRTSSAAPCAPHWTQRLETPWWTSTPGPGSSRCYWPTMWVPKGRSWRSNGKRVRARMPPITHADIRRCTSRGLRSRPTWSSTASAVHPTCSYSTRPAKAPARRSWRPLTHRPLVDLTYRLVYVSCD